MSTATSSGAAVTGSGLLASLSLENAGSGTLTGGVATLGQVFAQGELPAGSDLVAWIGGAPVPVQMDVKTTYPDGSVKMAVLSIQRPALPPGASVEVDLARADGPVAADPAIDLATAMKGHSFTVDLAVQGEAPIQIDVLTALQDALADGTASFWQEGGLATQARVEILVPDSSMRLVFDVTAFKGGGFQVDAQFNNDRAMEEVGGPVSYDLVVRMDGREVAHETVDQAQYQNWHREFSSNGTDGGQGIGDPSGGWLNIRQDVAKLEQLGAVADYDLTLDIQEYIFDEYQQVMSDRSWGDPLAANGVTQYMPMTGGRWDIGFTTQPNTVWLMSQDPRAAALALGQAEAAGSIPWNFWDTAQGTWFDADNYPSRWLTQDVDEAATGWATDVAHQPDLSFVPYLLTGERWILDNLNAQAAWNAVDAYQKIVVDGGQVRASAWSLRQIDNAAWANPDGSPEQAYFQGISDANWQWLVAQIPEWTALQGEAYGWLPGAYGSGFGAMAPWQQDYFASVAIAAASRGNQDALTFLEWAANFLIGRFQHAADGFDPHDGTAYNLAVGDPETWRLYTTWAEIGAMTVAEGMSSGKEWMDGDYDRLAMATLAGIYHLTGSTEALDVYRMLAALAPLGTTEIDYTEMPTYAVTIPGIYGGTVSGETGEDGSGGPGEDDRGESAEDADDDVILAAASRTLDIDLGDGMDSLTLADGRNTGVIRDVETIIGGADRDRLTLGAPVSDAFVDLGAGTDLLVLADGGNTVTVRQAESIRGGAGNDHIEVEGAVGARIQGSNGEDTITGGDGADSINGGADADFLAGGAGADTLIGGVGADTIMGGIGADIITGGADADSLVGDGGADILIGGVGADTITGGDGADSIIGGADADFLAGGAGADTLTGNAGADTITGGGGADFIMGGAGADVLAGGTGPDCFVYEALNQSPARAPDTILDFQPGKDFLVFDGLLKGEFAYLAAGAFSAAGNSEARFDAASHLLQVDVNGDGSSDISVILTGVSPNGLSDGNFLWH